MVDRRGLPAVGQQAQPPVVHSGREEHVRNVHLLAMIGAAIGTVGGAVIRVDIRGARKFRGGGVRQAMRIGPVGQHAEVRLHASLNGQKHAAVVGGASVIECGHVCEILTFGRILQIQDTALIGIVSRRTAWNVHRGILRLLSPQVGRLTSDVTRR